MKSSIQIQLLNFISNHANKIDIVDESVLKNLVGYVFFEHMGYQVQKENSAGEINLFQDNIAVNNNKVISGEFVPLLLRPIIKEDIDLVDSMARLGLCYEPMYIYEVILNHLTKIDSVYNHDLVCLPGSRYSALPLNRPGIYKQIDDLNAHVLMDVLLNITATKGLCSESLMTRRPSFSSYLKTSPSLKKEVSSYNEQELNGANFKLTTMSFKKEQLKKDNITYGDENLEDKVSVKKYADVGGSESLLSKEIFGNSIESDVCSTLYASSFFYPESDIYNVFEKEHSKRPLKINALIEAQGAIFLNYLNLFSKHLAPEEFTYLTGKYYDELPLRFKIYIKEFLKNKVDNSAQNESIFLGLKNEIENVPLSSKDLDGLWLMGKVHSQRLRPTLSVKSWSNALLKNEELNDNLTDPCTFITLQEIGCSLSLLHYVLTEFNNNGLEEKDWNEVFKCLFSNSTLGRTTCFLLHLSSSSLKDGVALKTIPPFLFNLKIFKNEIHMPKKVQMSATGDVSLNNLYDEKLNVINNLIVQLRDCSSLLTEPMFLALNNQFVCLKESNLLIDTKGASIETAMLLKLNNINKKNVENGTEILKKVHLHSLVEPISSFNCKILKKIAPEKKDDVSFLKESEEIISGQVSLRLWQLEYFKKNEFKRQNVNSIEQQWKNYLKSFFVKTSFVWQLPVVEKMQKIKNKLYMEAVGQNELNTKFCATSYLFLSTADSSVGSYYDYFTLKSGSMNKIENILGLPEQNEFFLHQIIDIGLSLFSPQSSQWLKCLSFKTLKVEDLEKNLCLIDSDEAKVRYLTHVAFGCLEHERKILQMIRELGIQEYSGLYIQNLTKEVIPRVDKLLNCTLSKLITHEVNLFDVAEISLRLSKIKEAQLSALWLKKISFKKIETFQAHIEKSVSFELYKNQKINVQDLKNFDSLKETLTFNATSALNLLEQKTQFLNKIKVIANSTSEQRDLESLVFEESTKSNVTDNSTNKISGYEDLNNKNIVDKFCTAKEAIYNCFESLFYVFYEKDNLKKLKSANEKEEVFNNVINSSCWDYFTNNDLEQNKNFGLAQRILGTLRSQDNSNFNKYKSLQEAMKIKRSLSIEDIEDASKKESKHQDVDVSGGVAAPVVAKVIRL